MNMPGALRSLKTKLFDEGGAEEIFSHLRNLILATIVIAAGSYVTRQPEKVNLFVVFNAQWAGYGVQAIGAILVALNFLDGFYKLIRFGSPWILRIALVVLYVIFSIRIVHFVVLLRGG